MERAEIIKELEDSEALLSGHFVLSSGLHSSMYVQCARALMQTDRAERLGAALAKKIRAEFSGDFDVVVAPAMGGLIIGYELARQLKLPSMFVERVEGKFELRRGFSINSGAKILIVEDVVTTGKSSMEAAVCLEALGAKPLAVASIIDRRNGNDVELKLPLISLLKLDIPAYKEGDLPKELAAIPASKPGSRFLKAV